MNSLPHFVSAGEALTDLVRSGPDQWTSMTGGAGLNVARAMARLDVPSAFAGAVSSDVFGHALQAAAQQAGLDPRFLQVSDRPPLLAVVHQTSPPEYFFIGENSADQQFSPWNLPRGWEAVARWVHFGGISLARQPLSDRLLSLAATLKAQGVRISYDPNFRNLMDGRYDQVLSRMAALADVIKVSDEDLHGLFRTDDIAAALSSLRALGPQADILLTRGAAGAELYSRARAWQAAPPAIAIADTIGAGDACISAFIYSRMQQPDAGNDAHLRFAVAAGAAACIEPGATPPDLAGIARLLPAVHAIALDSSSTGSQPCAS